MNRLLFFLPLFILGFTTALHAAPKRLLALGDSVTEGYGVARESAWPALVEKKIKAAGQDWVVINAGISGSTSASGPSRVKWQLKTKTDLMILALGANDGLRGLSTEETEKNLAQTVEFAQKSGTRVVLAGMLVPPNYGKDYTSKFEKIFQRVAKKYKIRLMPFLLEQVGGEMKFNQTDGIHPNEKGHEIIADNVYKFIQQDL